MKPSYRIECRCRVRGPVGEALAGMPRRRRSRTIGLTLAAVAEKLDLTALLESREQIRAAGVLLNQALRFGYADGVLTHETLSRVVNVVELIEALVKGGEELP